MSLEEAMYAAGVRQIELADETGLTRKAISATLRRERVGLGIRDETRRRYLAAISRILEKKRAQLVQANLDQKAAAENALEVLGAR